MSEIKINQNFKMMKLETIVPYWRNPRNNTEAVKVVVKSIQKYGVQLPILIDAKNVIIAGDTRYRAYKQEGVTEVPVMISDLPEDKAKEFRVIDNKSSEKATWDWSKLDAELREMDLGDFVMDFPELSQTPIDMSMKSVSMEDVQETEADLDNKFSGTSRQVTQKNQTITCPNCGEDIDLL